MIRTGMLGVIIELGCEDRSAWRNLRKERTFAVP